jgi:hypothetical protein
MHGRSPRLFLKDTGKSIKSSSPQAGIMPLTKVGSFMLFSLGLCYSRFELRFADRHVALMISKADFIDLMQRAGIAHKKERALYKNLQDLEEKRYISYEHRTLALTKKGQKVFAKLQRNMMPYLEVAGILGSDDILRFVTKRQTILKD